MIVLILYRQKINCTVIFEKNMFFYIQLGKYKKIWKALKLPSIVPANKKIKKHVNNKIYTLVKWKF